MVGCVDVNVLVFLFRTLSVLIPDLCTLTYFYQYPTPVTQ